MIPNIREIADKAGEATLEHLRKTQPGAAESFLRYWEPDRPAREAMCSAAIEAFLEGVKGLPSEEECNKIFWASTDLSGKAVRHAMLAAFAKQLQAVRALPGEWMKRLEQGFHLQPGNFVAQLNQALAGLDLPVEAAPELNHPPIATHADLLDACERAGAVLRKELDAAKMEVKSSQEAARRHKDNYVAVSESLIKRLEELKEAQTELALYQSGKKLPWISVEERLPTMEDVDHNGCYFISTECGGIARQNVRGVMRPDVTHWLKHAPPALPKPTTEENSSAEAEVAGSGPSLHIAAVMLSKGPITSLTLHYRLCANEDEMRGIAIAAAMEAKPGMSVDGVLVDKIDQAARKGKA